MSNADDVLPEAQQLAALSPEIMRDYASGSIAWSQIREHFGVTDFRLVLQRLGEEGLRLPRARADRPSAARRWLREVLEERAAAQ